MAVTYNEFIRRRLHSLTGIAPLGLFLFEHFFTNSYSHQGEAAFNEKVQFLRTLPFLFFIEWGVLFLPFLYHMFYGLYIMYTGEYTIRDQHNNRAWMYWLQRATAIPAFAFIMYHVISLRFMPHGAGEPNFYRIMIEKFNNPIILGGYVVGILCVVFHFANGIATFCMTWGITISPNSQRLMGYACIGIGFALAGAALWAVLGFVKPMPTEPGTAEMQHTMNLIFDNLRSALS